MSIVSRTSKNQGANPDSYPLRTVRRLFIAIAGFTVLILGIALIFLPGPAFLVIPLGLAILATEFVWAKRVLGELKKKLNDIRSRV